MIKYFDSFWIFPYFSTPLEKENNYSVSLQTTCICDEYNFHKNFRYFHPDKHDFH